MSNIDEPEQILQLGHIEIKPEEYNIEVNPDDLPILATRNLVLFPGVNIPINLGRESSLALAKRASEEKQPIGIVCQLDPKNDSPKNLSELYRYGVVADVFQVIDLPDGSHTAIVRARQRFRIIGKSQSPRFSDSISAKIKLLQDTEPSNQAEFESIMDEVTRLACEIATKSHNGDKMFSNAVESINDLTDRLNFIATNLPDEPEVKVRMLQCGQLDKRAMSLLRSLLDAQSKMKIYEDILSRAKDKMGENQRAAFLQSQMEAIKEELYGDGSDQDDFENLKERAQKANMPEYATKVFEKQLGKLKRLNPSTPDYSVEYSYLETLVDLPWGPLQADADIINAGTVLETQHFGLEKIKQRILEQIAVMINNPSAKTPIICLVGPPGVGKTSLGRSIAEAMKRKYVRVSLGGVHDEAEIRGHRRTYIGAMPGRIIKAMNAAGCTNPVMLLDEVDKLGRDHKGDPSSALLEVLDPEQNSTFHDNYLDLDYDLSKVLFIATANTLSTIDAPLLDRMEVIELSGYLLEEKLEIAKRHLLPKIFKENGLEEDYDFNIPDETLTAIIENYTAESGVRQLEKTLGSLLRKQILARLRGDEFPTPMRPSDLQALLGLPKYIKDKYEGNQIAGIVTGLAWTQAGGAILLAEASLSAGKGDRLSITGNLGDVMKESATIALQWVKSHAEALGIDVETFEKNNLHVHFPEGAIPKDGPSAGITIATAIASAFTGKPVREKIAMTGEITLRGRVLPVGGIKEKILAAKRAGIKTIVLCEDNRRDVEDIPSNYLTGLEFKYVRTMEEVAAFALNQ